MKLYIYIILFILLIVYINCHTKYISEKFNEHFSGSNLDNGVNQTFLKPILIEGQSGMVPAYDSDDLDFYKTKYWVIKNQGFSDIYNYEDLGSLQIFNLANGTNHNGKSKTESKVESKAESNQIQLEIKYNNLDYKLVGIASNQYFNQYYYLYEYETKTNLDRVEPKEELAYLNNKVYEYLLVKTHENKQEVVHYVGPRNKININDVVYFSLGVFQLGPLSISKIN